MPGSANRGRHNRLDDTLASAGYSNGMFVNPHLPAGIAYVCRAGNVGTIGFEVPLTVETWRDASTRSWWMQAFCVPAFAVDRPFAAKKITGLSSRKVLTHNGSDIC